MIIRNINNPTKPKLIYPSAKKLHEILLNVIPNLSEIKEPDPIGLLGQIDLGTKKKNTPNNCLPHVIIFSVRMSVKF